MPICFFRVLLVLLMADYSPLRAQSESTSPAFLLDTRDYAGDPAALALATSNAFVLETRDFHGTPTALADATSNAFSLETRGDYLGASGPVAVTASSAFPLDTRNLSIQSLTISGPETVSGGSSGSYTATVTYTGGGQEDVSGRCSWSLVGAEGTAEMAGGGTILSAEPRSTPLAVKVVATLQTDSQTRRAFKSVTLTGGFDVNLTNLTVGPPSGTRFLGQWSLSALAVVRGGTQPFNFHWTQPPGAPLGSTGGNPQFSGTLIGSAGAGQIVVTVTDGAGRTSTARKRYVLPLPPAPAEPATIPPGRSAGVSLLMPDGITPFSYANNPARSGLIIIAHGLHDQPGAWQTTMAANIAAKLAQEGKPAVDIAVLDWREGADPISQSSGSPTRQEKLRGLSLALLGGPAGLGIKAGEALTDTAGKAVNFLGDVMFIKSNALRQGQWLSDWLKAEAVAGRITVAKKVQIIGHSAGGFVAGEAGLRALHNGVRLVDRVTMLDTPIPEKAHYATYPSVSQGAAVERYISSLLGAVAPQLESHNPELIGGSVFGTQALGRPYSTQIYQVAPGESYYRRVTPDGPPGWPLMVLARHSWAWEWFTRTAATAITEEDGFFYSPFMGNAWPSSGAPAAAAPRNQPRNGTVSSSLLTGWTLFGSVSTDATGYTLTESATNAGLTKLMTLPADVESLTFDAQFTQAGDDDYLAVYWGDQPALYALADLPLTREGLVRCEIDLRSYAGETNQLTIKLESLGAVNAIARLENLRLSRNTDIDGDGLSTAQETTAGTDPQRFDTDGDGISDNDELNTTLTNPLALDTDGDGSADGLELTIGTDPRLASSRFHISTEESLANGTVSLTWTTVPGRTYRITRAADLSGSESDVITPVITASGSTLTITDPAPPSGRSFYQAEQLE